MGTGRSPGRVGASGTPPGVPPAARRSGARGTAAGGRAARQRSARHRSPRHRWSEPRSTGHRTSGRPAGGRPARRWGATVVGGLVLLAGTGGAAAYALGRETGPAPAGPAAVPTGRPVVTPTDRAMAELAEAVADGAGVGRRRARCIAGRLVAVEGLGRLVGSGVVTADGRFLDPDLTGEPALRRSLARVARSCR